MASAAIEKKPRPSEHPKHITSATGAILWTWQGDPFGNSQPSQAAITPTISNAQIGATAQGYTYNQRFAGQTYDKETGLYYNYFRHYDPATGRYVEADPIGLEGGWNRYAYVGGNPVTWNDPMGLATMNLFEPWSIKDAIVRWGAAADSGANNDYPGMMVVYGHGARWGNFITDSSSGEDIRLSPKKLAEKIKKNSGYQAGMPVWLKSCELGKGFNGQPSFAQQLANELNVAVYAAKGGVFFSSKGITGIGPEDAPYDKSRKGEGAWFPSFPQPKK